MRHAALLAAASLAFAGLASGCGTSGAARVGQEQQRGGRVLTMIDPLGDSEQLAPFANEVSRLSHGALRIRIVRSGHTGEPDYEAAAIRDVQHGRADLAYAGARAWDEFGARSLSALSAPLLIDNYPLQERVLAGDVAMGMLRQLRPLGLVGIGFIPGPMRHPFGVSRRLVAPADYAGLTIGTQQSRVADATMRALGARPVRLSVDTRSLAGLDGLERQVFSIEGSRVDVRGSHVTSNVDLWPRPLVIFAARRAYARLTHSQHDLLRTAAANAMPKASQMVSAREAEATGNVCRKGGVTFDTASPAELRALRQAVEPVYQAMEHDSATRAAIAAIERLKQQTAQPPATLPHCAAPAARPGAKTTAVDGVWQMDSDRRDAGPDQLDENWGHWIFVFGRGQFAITQENRAACTWGYGTYSVNGTQTAWRFKDGGGIAPNNAENKPGEFFVFRLSRYHDTLTLDSVKGRISPMNFRVKPWRRLSGVPTRRFFSKRCPPPAAALTG